jgi:probable HAF family extracellular repeat protein
MSIKRNVLNTLASIAVAALPAIGFAQTAPTFHVTNLGSGPCVWEAINDSGVLAGTCNNDAAIWRNGVVTDMGRIAGGTYANATAINSLGVIVGDGDTGNGRPNPFISVNGTLLNVDPISGGNARAVGIMENGVIFGNLTKSLSGNTASWNVVMWTQDPGHPDRYRENILPHYPGGDSKFNGVYALASNKAGQVVGWVTTSIIGQLGGFWNNDSTHTVAALSALPDGNHSIAQGINDLGQAVGYSNTLQQYSRAVLWQNDAAHTVVDLGTLPGDLESQATAINTAGQIIGTSSLSFFSGTPRAFFYQNGTMYDLATLIDPVDGFWTIESAFAMNNSGQIIAGGTSGGVKTWILLTPVAQ